MDNLGILIQAILSLKDTTASKNQIAKELPKLESQLQSDKNTRVKVVAGLDISKSKNLIQSQLNTLTSQAKAPTIKVGVDVSKNIGQDAVNSLKNVQSQAQQTAESVKQTMTEITSENISSKTVSEFQKAFNIIGQNAKDTQQTFKGLFAELNNAWYAGDEEKYLNVLEQIYNIAQNTTKVVSKSKSEIKELTDQIRSDFTDGSTAFISPKTKEELKYILEDSKKIKRVLDSVFGVGKWTYNQNKGIGTDVLANDIKELQGNANEILEVYKQIQNIKSSTQHTVFDSLGGDSASKDAINEHLHNVLNLTDAYRDLQGVEHTYIQGLGWFETLETETENIREETTAIESQTKATEKLKAIRESITRDANGQQIGRTSVFGDTGFTKTSRYDENDNLTSYTETQNFQNIEKSLAKASVEATKLQTKLDGVKSKYSDINATKPIKNSEHIQQLEKQYNTVQQAIDKVKTADSNSMAQMKANAESEIKQLENLVQGYKNAEYAATSLRTKDLDTNKAIQTQELDRFISKISSNKSIFNAMTGDIDQLKISLGNITDATSFTKFLNELDIAKSKFESLKTMYQAVGGYDKQLDKLAQDWQKQGIYVGNLKKTIESLKSSLANVTNVDELSSWVNNFDTQIGKISQLPVQISKCKEELSSTTSEWEKQHLYVGKIAEKAASLGRSISGIRKPEKFDEWVKEWTDLNSQVNKLKINLDSQVEKQNKIYEIQAKINSLDSNKNSNEIAKLQESLSLEEKKISNLQFQSNVYSKLISKEEKENYILKNTTEAREKLNTSFAKLEDKSIQSQTQQLNDYENQINKTVSKLNSLQNSNVFSKNASNPQVIQIKQEISDLTKEYQKLMVQTQGNITPAGLETLESELNKLNTRFNSACAIAEQFERELKDDNSAEQLAKKISVLTARIEAFRKVNSKSEKLFGGEYDRILSQLNDPNIDLETYNRLNKEFQKLRLEINKADKAGQSFFGKLKDQATKFASWMTLTGIIAGAWREVRKMITEVVELDNSLLELSKVSDLTADGLKQITTEAYSLGKEVGKTGTQVIDAITNFKRAGFDLQQSTSFAKDALILTNVAEGIDDASEAATALISIMKGYGDTTPEFSQKILDSINEVSNTQAINFDDLVDGSQRLSAVAKQAGASFEEMLGILTGTNEVLQNIEKTSSGEITIFTRLQGIQLPDEEDVMPIAKLQETISTATKGAANVVDQTSGELRNVYDILDDINKVWDTLDKNTQEGIAFAAAGTRQKNVFLSMMQNWENVKKATESAMDSTGSATKENQKYLDSIQGKLSTLQSTFQSLSNTVINSDLIKFVVDGGTNILNILDKIIDKVGTLPTVLGGVAAVLSAKNVGELQNKNTPVSIQPQIICIENVTRLKIRLSNCWDDYAKAL